MPTPPSAPREVMTHELHGDRRSDPYAWLKDENWRTVMQQPEALAPRIRAYLDAENDHTNAVLAGVRELQSTLFAELKGRIKEDDSSVPARDGAYLYYVRYQPKGQHPIYCRKSSTEPIADSAAGAEEVLLHGDEEARGHSYFNVAACDHSPDHASLAYAVDYNGSEIYTIRFKALATGTLYPDEITNAHGAIAWANDAKTLFYTALDDNHRPSRVLRHRLGTSPDDDVVVYEERDPGFFVSLSVTESRRYVLISAHDHTTSEVHLIDADEPDQAPLVVAERTAGLEYSVAHHGERLIILTNADEAEDFKLVETALDARGREHWRDFVSHRAGVLLVAFTVFEDYFVRFELVDALPRIVVSAFADGASHEICFDEEAYSLGLVEGYEFRTDTLRFTYSSLTTPQRTFDYDMRQRSRELRKEQEVPSGHDPAVYVARRLFATSDDAEQVPISVLHRRDTPIDGRAPLLLYGYGAYGHSMPASFSTARFSLVNRGFVYAIAHVRGGMERGYRWYRQGKLQKKKNSFDDFIAVAEHLIDHGYTRAGHIACHGGSAGGMLVGSVTNMRPDLFRATVAEVPFVDVLNTMCDDALPLTPPEWPEWGNPIESKADYDNIKSYSAYDNVAETHYPHIFVTAGLTDPRVTYWEPAKWVARLREMKRDNNVLLLKTNMSAGHAGAAGRFDHLEEVAEVYAFLLMVFRLETRGAT